MTNRLSRFLSRVLVAGMAATILFVSSSGAAALPMVPSDEIESAAATITLSQSSDTIREDGTLTVGATVTNTGTEPLPAGTANIAASPTPFASRLDLTNWLAATADLRLPTELASVDVPALAPGQSHRIDSVSVPRSELGFTVLGASYPLRAYYSSGEVTAQKRQSVLFVDDDTVTAVPTTLIVPLTVPARTTGLLSAEELETLTAPDGYLTLALNAVRGQPVTLAIDPLILASIRVLGRGAPTAATEWLTELAAADLPSFLLQYADADPSVQAQAGLDRLLNPAGFEFAMTAGNFPAVTPTPTPSPSASATPTPTPSATESATPTPTVEYPSTAELLDWTTSLDGVVWPSAGTVAAADLGVFAGSGAKTTIVSSSQVESTTSFTPAAHQAASGTSLLVSDDSLSAIVGGLVGAASTHEDPTALGDLRREYAAMASEPGGASRAHLVTLDRTWNPAGLDVAITALRSLGVDPVSLASVLGTTDSDVDFVAGTASEDRLTRVDALLEGETRIVEFSDVLETPALLIGQERSEVLALLATAWTTNTDGWRTAVQDHATASAATLSAITLVPTEQFNMVSWQSTLGFSVRNNLDYPAAVTLTIAADNLRLSIAPSVSEVIPARTTVKYQVPVSARIGNGRTNLTLGLTSASGRQLAAPTTVLVNVRADWEKIGLAILGGVVAVLLAGGVFRTLRGRRRRARAAGPDDAVVITDSGLDDTDADPIPADARPENPAADADPPDPLAPDDSPTPDSGPAGTESSH